MARRYLIDGYNLIHALGFLHRADGSRTLEKARHRLLEHLATALAGDAPAATIIFDARRPPRGLRAEQRYKGLHVAFAVGFPQADDAIEALLEHSAPHQVVVVSSDHRLQHAARRRGAEGWSCARFLDQLDREPGAASSTDAPQPEKQERLTEDEARQWLEEFKDLAEDEEFKELFDPYPFADENE